MYCLQKIINNIYILASSLISFSKLKLVKPYLKSTISLEILIGFVKNNVSKIWYKHFIINFASQKKWKYGF